ncbi:Eif3a, partial [Symbiodinium necroappetens]
VEGTIRDAKNGSPHGWAYECEAQTACKARKDSKGYFRHRGYHDGYPTFHLLVPGEETWTKDSHGGLVAAVMVKREAATAAVPKAGRGGAAPKAAAKRVLKKPSKRS